jgi:hypothetical protein
MRTSTKLADVRELIYFASHATAANTTARSTRPENRVRAEVVRPNG